MAATDVAPNRIGAAADQARRLAGSLPAGTPVTLIAAGDEVAVLLSSSADRTQLDRALGVLEPSGGADLATALELAAAIAAGEPNAEVAVLSDGGVSMPEHITAPPATRYVAVGASGENQAISALSLDPGAAGQGLAAFVRVTNYGQQEAARRLTLTAYGVEEAGAAPSGALVTARDLTIPAGDGLAMTFADLPAGTVYVEARLAGEDLLADDDQAWAVAPVVTGAQIQIVGPGNRFLETALSLLPGVEVTTISLEDYEAAWADPQAAEAQSASEDPEAPINWLTVFDTVLPEEGHYPAGALLFIGPLHSTEFFSVTGVMEAPAARPASANEPLLRFIDLRDLAIQQAAQLALPKWGRAAIVGGSGQSSDGQAPLLVTGEDEGRRLAVLAFDLRGSDLPLRVAFPLLLANLVDYLAPGTTGALPENVQPGQPVALPLPPQAEVAVVRAPDGRETRLPVSDTSLLYANTNDAGVYQVDWEAEGARWLLGRFAVNGSSPLESNIAPRAELALGGSGGDSIAAERPVRQEWWRWLAWGALALLAIEWLVQYRGALVRLWERIRGGGAQQEERLSRPVRVREAALRGEERHRPGRQGPSGVL